MFRLILLIAIAMLLFGIYNSFSLPAKIESYRIVFLHVPSAIASYLAFTVSFIYSISFLRNSSPKSDEIASRSAKFGFIMAIVAFISGAIWAKETWGAYFTWYEIREVIVLLMLFIYAVYFSLRNLVEEKARISAIYLIIAYITVPLSYISGFFSPLHPRPFEAEFSPEWRLNLILMIISFALIYASYMLKETRKINQKAHKT
ncbi:MAG: cytochrome c biogenesis protein CcsA [Archaeoglobales archaeon]|nr:cytochrome c biogenesis protein CcsA [Archaeoglobales archaeon]